MSTGYKSDFHRHCVELWLGGMDQGVIAVHEGKSVASVREALKKYCDRERVYSKDGRSWHWKLAREVHPSAPMTDSQQSFYWPSPVFHWSAGGRMGDDDEEGPVMTAVRDILETTDDLNEAIERLEWNRGWRAVINVVDGRVSVAVVEKPEESDSPGG